MIDVFLALIFAITGTFLVFWITIGCVVVTLWLIPFSVLCLYEVGGLAANVFKGLIRPLVWVACLIDERLKHESAGHLRVNDLNLDRRRSLNLPGLQARRNSNAPDHKDASQFLRIRPL